MKQFEVYFTEIEYEDQTGESERPSVVVDIFESEDLVYALGIYTYRKFFDDEENAGRFLEILDTEVAGLDTSKGSFIKVRSFVKLNSFSSRKSKFLGHLSARDIERLISVLGEE